VGGVRSTRLVAGVIEKIQAYFQEQTTDYKCKSSATPQSTHAKLGEDKHPTESALKIGVGLVTIHFNWSYSPIIAPYFE
jgi:hypothetical protein